MDLLEHPFEAVAFRLYSLPESSAATGAAAWTCLAAILAAAAAAGLWRLRATSAAPTAVVATAATKPLELDPAPADEAPTTAPSCASEEPAPAAPSPSPKERYTAYYYRDPCCVGCCDDAGDELYARGDGDDDREDEAEERDGGDAAGAYRTPSETTTTGPFGWEEEVVRSLPLGLSPTAAKVEMRLGLGLYGSPTAALGGSVVQLWDQVAGGGLFTPTASPRWRNRGAAAAAPSF